MKQGGIQPDIPIINLHIVYRRNTNQSKTALFCRDLNPKSINTIQKAVKRNKTDNWEREISM
jgi:hypothetical protein